MSFSFGTTPGQPAANSTGFAFGAPKTNAAPAFGTATPTATPATGLGGGTTSFSFGAPAAAATAPAPNFNFGSAPATGTAATAQPTLGLGAPAAGTAAAPAFGLGATAASTTTAPTFGLGSTTAAAPTFGLGGGTAAPSLGLGTTPAFGLGGQTTATTAAAAPTLGLGGTTTAAPTLGLGSTTAPAPTFGLGGTTQPAAAPTFGLGGGSTISGGLFGKQPNLSQAPTTGLNFNTTTTSAGLSLGASGGLFGKPATSQAPTNTTAPFVGLGGIDVSATQPKAGASKQDIKVKETLVPDEIAKTVEQMKNYIKAQKQISSDIGRVSTSKLTKVSTELARLKTAIQNIANSVEANYGTTQMLRRETSNANNTVDMAQRTQDTPAGLQFENNAPFLFFQDLVNRYEQELLSLKQHITLTEHHMRSLTNPQTVTPEDLKRCLQQINESFISLAGRLHEIHQKVEMQKEQFLKLRKYRLNDSTNVFASIDKPAAKTNTTHLTGRTPFTNISAISSLNKMYSNLSASGVNKKSVTNKTNTFNTSK